MELSGKINAYCERGLDPSFWAEPVNALTNLSFVVLAGLAWRELGRRSGENCKPIRYFLIGNVFLIGAGSFLFHTYATKWASIADVAPIGVFMVAYLAFGLHRFVRVPPPAIPLILAGFIFLTYKAMRLQCWQGAIGFSLPAPAFESTACLNGSVAYMPALATMALIGGWMAARMHPAASYVLGASLVFMLSITFRTVDRLWCHDVMLGGAPLGTHFLWHIFNGVTLYLLLLAAVRHGVPERARVMAVAR